MMKPINEMTDEEVIEELSTFQTSAVINLKDMEEARKVLHMFRTVMSLSDDEMMIFRKSDVND